MKGPILTPLLVDAGPEAIDSVMSVMEDAFDTNFGEAWNRDQCLGIIGLPGVWLTLALYDEQIAGFTLVRVIVDEAELLLIAVTPQLHARGIGSMLLNAVIKDATRRAANKLHLEVAMEIRRTRCIDDLVLRLSVEDALIIMASSDNLLMHLL